MAIIAKIVGVLIAGLGILFVIYPDRMKKVMAFWKEGKNIYWAGVIRLVIGVIILMAASGSGAPFAAAALGLLFLASGAVIFVLGLESDKKLIEFWESQPDPALRLMAAFAVIFGLLIFSIV